MATEAKEVFCTHRHFEREAEKARLELVAVQGGSRISKALLKSRAEKFDRWARNLPCECGRPADSEEPDDDPDDDDQDEELEEDDEDDEEDDEDDEESEDDLEMARRRAGLIS